MLRAARRRAGLSQREMAQRAGVGLTALVAAEAERRGPSWSMVSQVLAAAGLEPAIDLRRGPACDHLVRHLQLSLSQRLYVALGGTVDTRMALRAPPHPPAWPLLPQWAWGAELHVHGASAVGLWVPGVPPVSELVRSGATCVSDSAEAQARATGLQLVEGGRDRTCSVTVPLPVSVLHVPPPHELALDPGCAPWRRALRVAAGLLDAQAARDRAGRRVAAHLVLDRPGEQERSRWSRPWGDRMKPPDVLDGRGWRLQDEGSFSDWLDRRARRG